MRKRNLLLLVPLALAACEVKDETPQQPTTTTTTTTTTVGTTTTTLPAEQGTTTTVHAGTASAVKRGQFCSTPGETVGNLTCTSSATESRNRWR